LGIQESGDKLSYGIPRLRVGKPSHTVQKQNPVWLGTAAWDGGSHFGTIAGGEGKEASEGALIRPWANQRSSFWEERKQEMANAV
jgi:hypothetical protein